MKAVRRFADVCLKTNESEMKKIPRESANAQQSAYYLQESRPHALMRALRAQLMHAGSQ